MTTISKANKPRNAPGRTRNGKVKYVALGLAKLQELVDNANRPRDKHKYQTRINYLLKQEKKKQAKKQTT